MSNISSASDLIGPARSIATAVLGKIERNRETGTPLRILFTGAPGVGKSAIANLAARTLCGHELGVEVVNGADVGADMVRKWRTDFISASMFSDWRCIVIEEGNHISQQAQVLLLTLLDSLPRHRAIFVTSNLDTSEWTERFQTRFQFWKVEHPSQNMIEDLLGEKYPTIPAARRREIVKNCAGNVRSALMDADTMLDWIEAQHYISSSQ